MEKGQWTLSELLRECLDHLGEGGGSNRINWTPDARQVRYYTSLGLMDRPFGGRGHGNTYSPKHLLQLLAVKKLQTKGVRLAEMPEMLAGLSESRVAGLLGLGADWLASQTLSQSEIATRRRERVWSDMEQAKTPTKVEADEVRWRLEPGAEVAISGDNISELTVSQQKQLFHSFKEVWRSGLRCEDRSRSGSDSQDCRATQVSVLQAGSSNETRTENQTNKENWLLDTQNPKGQQGAKRTGLYRLVASSELAWRVYHKPDFRFSSQELSRIRRMVNDAPKAIENLLISVELETSGSRSKMLKPMNYLLASRCLADQCFSWAKRERTSELAKVVLALVGRYEKTLESATEDSGQDLDTFLPPIDYILSVLYSKESEVS